MRSNAADMRRAMEASLREARKICAFEFEPLWRPAATLVRPCRALSALEREDVKAVAKREAFAWLAAKLGLQQLTSFDEIEDVALLRRAYALIWNATIADVRRWVDEQEAEAA